MALALNQNVTYSAPLRSLNAAVGAQNRSLERLSSGLRINRASDDVAGLVGSETLRAQIGGLRQVNKNIQQAINYGKTSEAALDEVASLLVQLRSLVIEAENVKDENSERFDAARRQSTRLLESITRIGATTRFAGRTPFNEQVPRTVTFGDDRADSGVAGASVPLRSIIQNGSHTILTRQQAVISAVNDLAPTSGSNYGEDGTVIDSPMAAVGTMFFTSTSGIVGYHSGSDIYNATSTRGTVTNTGDPQDSDVGDINAAATGVVAGSFSGTSGGGYVYESTTAAENNVFNNTGAVGTTVAGEISSHRIDDNGSTQTYDTDIISTPAVTQPGMGAVTALATINRGAGDLVVAVDGSTIHEFNPTTGVDVTYDLSATSVKDAITAIAYSGAGNTFYLLENGDTTGSTNQARIVTATLDGAGGIAITSEIVINQALANQTGTFADNAALGASVSNVSIVTPSSVNDPTAGSAPGSLTVTFTNNDDGTITYNAAEIETGAAVGTGSFGNTAGATTVTIDGVQMRFNSTATSGTLVTAGGATTVDNGTGSVNGTLSFDIDLDDLATRLGVAAPTITITGPYTTGAQIAGAIQTAVRAEAAGGNYAGQAAYANFTASFAGGNYTFTSGTAGMVAAGTRSSVRVTSTGAATAGTSVGGAAASTAAIQNGNLRVELDGGATTQYNLQSVGAGGVAIAAALQAALGGANTVSFNGGTDTYTITSGTTGATSEAVVTAGDITRGKYTGVAGGSTTGVTRAQMTVTIDGAAQTVQLNGVAGGGEAAALESAIETAFGGGNVTVTHLGGGQYEIQSVFGNSGQTSTVDVTSIAATNGSFAGSAGGSVGVLRAALTVNVDGAGAQVVKMTGAGAGALDTAIENAFGAGTVTVTEAGGLYTITSAATGSSSSVAVSNSGAIAGKYTGNAGGSVGAERAAMTVDIDGAGPQVVKVVGTGAGAIDTAIENVFGAGTVSVTDLGGGQYEITSAATGSTSSVAVSNSGAIAGKYTGAAGGSAAVIRAAMTVDVDGAGAQEVLITGAGAAAIDNAIEAQFGAGTVSVTDLGGGQYEVTSAATGSTSSIAVTNTGAKAGTWTGGAGATSITTGVDDQLTIAIDGGLATEITMGTQGTGADIATAMQAQINAIVPNGAGVTVAYNSLGGGEYLITSASSGSTSSVVVTNGTNDAFAVLAMGGGAGQVDGYDNAYTLLAMGGGAGQENGYDNAYTVFAMGGGAGQEDGYDNAYTLLNMAAGAGQVNGYDDLTAASGSGGMGFTGGTGLVGADNLASLLKLGTGGGVSQTAGNDDGAATLNLAAGATTDGLDIQDGDTFTVDITSSATATANEATNIQGLTSVGGTIYAVGTSDAGNAGLFTVNTSTGVTTYVRSLQTLTDFDGNAVNIAAPTGIARESGNVVLISDATKVYRYDIAANRVVDVLSTAAGGDVAVQSSASFNGSAAFAFIANGGTVSRVDLRDNVYSTAASRQTTDLGAERNGRVAGGLVFYEGDDGAGAYSLRLDTAGGSGGANKDTIAVNGAYLSATAGGSMDADASGGAFRALYTTAGTTIRVINSANAQQDGGAISGTGAKFSNTGAYLALFNGGNLEIWNRDGTSLLSTISNVDSTKGFAFNGADSQITFVASGAAPIGASGVKVYNVNGSGVATPLDQPDPTITGTFSPVYTTPGPAQGPTVVTKNTLQPDTFTITITQDNDGPDQFEVRDSQGRLYNNDETGDAFGVVGQSFTTRAIDPGDGVFIGGGLQFTLSTDGQYVDAATGNGNASKITITVNTQLEARLDNGPTVIFREGETVVLRDEHDGELAVSFGEAIPSGENTTTVRIDSEKKTQIGTTSNPSDQLGDLITTPLNLDRLGLASFSLNGSVGDRITNVTDDLALLNNNLLLTLAPQVKLGAEITAYTETFTITFTSENTYDISGSNARTISTGNVFSTDGWLDTTGMSDDEKRAELEKATANHIEIRGIEFILKGKPTSGVTFSYTFEGEGNLSMVDEAIRRVSDRRSRLGSAVNELESMLQSQTVAMVNLTRSEATIRDADYAETLEASSRAQLLATFAQRMLRSQMDSQFSIVGLLGRSISQGSVRQLLS